MPRTYSAKKPKDMRYTLGRLLEYLGHEKFSFLLIALLVFASVSLELVGTYMIKPVVNNLLEGGGKILLLKGVVLTATIYLTAIAMAFLYTRILARSAQKVVFDIRKDLFFHMESLPLSFFDKKKHGDLMSTYTNDVDTISDAMNNSFASVIKNFIQVFGTG